MPQPLFFLKRIPVIALTCMSMVHAHAQSADNAEHAQLTLLVRQLDMLERSASQGEMLSHAPTDRYHFDYQRLHRDIQHVRTGIQDYLTPRRAQPRDPIEITGHYVRDTGTGEAQP